jgi:hypothetical protein
VRRNKVETETGISDVLHSTIKQLATGMVYDLARGLMLSTCTREALLEALLAELDERAKVARQADVNSSQDVGKT